MKNTNCNVVLNHLTVLLLRGTAVKTHRQLLLAVLLLCFVAMVAPAETRADVIRIVNQRTDTVKVCVYRSTDSAWVFPIRCWTLEAEQIGRWDRGQDTTYFDIRVFQPGMLDRALCERRELSNAAQLKISAGPCAITPFNPPRPSPEPPAAAESEPPAKNYTLRVCNTTGATVQFALGYFIKGVNFVGEGWWLVSKDSCMNIDMSEVWKPQGLKDGSFAPTFMYAKSGRYFQQIWEGRAQDYDPSFCINQKKAFAIRKFEIKNNERFIVPCKGANLEEVYFFGIPNPEFNATYYWTFK